MILHHSTTISSGYQPVVHCGVLRQSAQMVAIGGNESLKTGESEFLIELYLNICLIPKFSGAVVRFKFLYFAEYILPGSTFLFREGRAKGVGKVLRVYYEDGSPDASVESRGVAVAAARR
jgi:GTPase